MSPNFHLPLHEWPVRESVVAGAPIVLGLEQAFDSCLYRETHAALFHKITRQ